MIDHFIPSFRARLVLRPRVEVAAGAVGASVMPTFSIRTCPSLAALSRLN